MVREQGPVLHGAPLNAVNVNAVFCSAHVVPSSFTAPAELGLSSNPAETYDKLIT